MKVKTWLISRIRDDAKHAEIDEREKRTEQRVAELRAEREETGVGLMFGPQRALSTHPHHPRYPRGGRP